MRKNLGFTLIEMLIVITIIGLLASVTALSYTQVSKQSRDARRKTDLEQLRGALEQYKGTNNYYPTSSNYISELTGNPKYMESIPDDPKPGNPSYVYTASPASCNNTVTYCTSYQIVATLENPVATYTVTPYGVVVVATPTPTVGPVGPGGLGGF